MITFDSMSEEKKRKKKTRLVEYCFRYIVKCMRSNSEKSEDRQKKRHAVKNHDL